MYRARHAGYRHGEAISVSNLGSVHERLGRYEEAIAYQQAPLSPSGSWGDAAFSRDGHMMVSAGNDATVRVWECEACGPVDEVLTLAKKRVTRELTSEEREAFLP